jgi:hypothetical protein
VVGFPYGEARSVSNVVDLAAYRKRPTLREPKPARRPVPGPPPLSVPEAIAICERHADVLNSWEAGFLASIRRLSWLSDKQLVVLQRIFDKVCAAAETWP